MAAPPVRDERPPAGHVTQLPPGERFEVLVRAFGVSATLVWVGRGVALEGVAATYYGKQMAQEIARKAGLVVVANRIRVDRLQSPKS